MNARNPARLASLAAVAAALLAGCGGVESVDKVLSTGQVTGALSNAKPGAYVYVFGNPKLKAKVESDGSFRIDKVPVGDGGKAQIVMYDGGDVGDGRAEIVDVDVQPAARTHKDRDARDMPVAGSIVAAVRCSGGQRGDDAKYTVSGTEFDKRGGGSVVTLFPVPRGSYEVRTALAGFKDGKRSVDVAEGATITVDVDMDEDEGDSHRGCLSTQCTGSLKCSDDGRCYQCVKQNGVVSGCPNATDDCEEHVCVPAGSDLHGRSACLPCTNDGQCSPIGAGGLCIPASDAGGGNVCSRTCNPANNDTDCPSGYHCGTAPDGRTACVAAPSCSAVLQAFGQACTDDLTCPSGLADAKCQGRVKKNSTVISGGYCTSRCTTSADCPATGFTCLGAVCQMTCTTNADCLTSAGFTCSGGICVKP